VTTNWAGNYTYQAQRILRPASVPELQRMVADSEHVRALGSGHSFTDLPDTVGVLISLDQLPNGIEIDSQTPAVSVGGGMRYGELANQVHRSGWALSNLASLPHISVAGAVATGTHGSGTKNQSLSCSVRALEFVGPDGDIRTIRRGDPSFDGYVISLGALGIVVRMVLDLVPTYDLTSTQFTDLSWEVLDAHFEEVMGSGYSVSLFTRWKNSIDQAWVKSRSLGQPVVLFDATEARETLHMLEGGSPGAVTAQRGVPGPWHERLPHFRGEFTPSRGAELQSEFFLPRDRAGSAFSALRGLAQHLDPWLQVSEIRTIAADELWLSGSYRREAVAIHFTWIRDAAAVYPVLRLIEGALLPLGARPHWGKCFTAERHRLAAAFPKLPDYAALRRAADPRGKFVNRFVETLIG
jgi:alditol oxidase